MDIRRVVTGHDASGKSVFVSDETVAPVMPALMPTAEFHQLWGGDDTPQFPDDGSMPDWRTYFPPIGGFRFGMFTVPPGVAGAEQAFSPQRRRWQTWRRSCPGSPGTWTHRIRVCTPPTPSTSRWCSTARSS